MESKDTYNPKSLCAIEGRIESLQLRLSEVDTLVMRTLVAFDKAARTLKKQNEHLVSELQKHGIFINIDDIEVSIPFKSVEPQGECCVPECSGCGCESEQGRPCSHCENHGDTTND